MSASTQREPTKCPRSQAWKPTPDLFKGWGFIGLRVQGLGFRVGGLGFRVGGLGLGV